MDILASPIPSSIPRPHAAVRPAARPLALGVIGPGRVGTALLDQLCMARDRLAVHAGLALQLRGVATRHRMWLDCDDPQLNRRSGAQVWRPAELDAFAAHVRGGEGVAVLVDCSASEAVADRYAGWLAAGLHVVTPNKLAGSGPLARWRAIREAAAAGSARWRYEATVGAGLPVIQTLRDLLDTGDSLQAIDGMFSGTLAWLCNRHDGAQPFSALLREAHALGYTEPDPREDLSGADVARKLVILAREAGWPLSLQEVEVESLVPPALASLPCDAFLGRLAQGALAELDAPLAERLAQARAAGGVLRHVASLDADGRAKVRLQVLPAQHTFAHTHLTDNVVQLRTARYCDNPLIVQGPGAGPQVTAAGVFADVLRIAEAQGARA
ncbi:MAG TPA: homoserine dehydrogenase [Frateuria sp.]|uniref:homoserine dehydrogenase n=1 Tax=Frateuria sp. TaxID=2211372 RepID=UPI002DEA647E|nr:homoserine dehydrogenase [Frateuria sp.]